MLWGRFVFHPPSGYVRSHAPKEKMGVSQCGWRTRSFMLKTGVYVTDAVFGLALIERAPIRDGRGGVVRTTQVLLYDARKALKEKACSGRGSDLSSWAAAATDCYCAL